MSAFDRNPFASDWLRGPADEGLRPPGAMSYVAGATAEPLKFMTIAQLLDRACERWGGRDAAVFVESGRRLSWHDLRRLSDEVAAGLLALGIRRGNRVGIWAPNRLEWLLAQFGTARIGAVLVNINPAYRTHELEHALNSVRCRALITARRLKSSDYLAMLQSLAPELGLRPDPAAAALELHAERLPHLKHLIVLGDGPLPAPALAFERFAAAAGPAQQARLASVSAALDPDDPINIQFTSGTTGLPKGATLTHFNIVNNARFCAKAMRLSATDRLCIPVPLYHCFGMVMGVLNCVTHGAAMVLPAPVFDPLATLQAVQDERCTALYGVPTMFIAELDHPRFAEFDLTSLRTGIMAGAPCPVEVMKRVLHEMHMREVTISYGMTETSPVSFMTSPIDPLDKRVETVGRILPRLEGKIVDVDGRVVPIGERGELCTRGYSVMLGYWGEEAKTREAVDAARWMHTGDLATMDAEGYVKIVGRIKDMLIRGGENVYPREIEEFLYRHPKVQDVQVFGVPDAKFGEEICAWIVVKEGQVLDEAEVKAFCKGQIAHYKVPRYVRVVQAFPMTVTGKIQKFVMRAEMVQLLGLDEAGA